MPFYEREEKILNVLLEKENVRQRRWHFWRKLPAGNSLAGNVKQGRE